MEWQFGKGDDRWGVDGEENRRGQSRTQIIRVLLNSTGRQRGKLMEVSLLAVIHIEEKLTGPKRRWERSSTSPTPP